MELSQDVEHRPIIFIRFNPDDYINNNNDKQQSCWSTNNRNGVCMVKKTYLQKWQNRLNILKENIEYWTMMCNQTDKTLEVIQLFYDGFA
jgi:hypothetical protein